MTCTLACGCSDKGQKDPGTPISTNPDSLQIGLVVSLQGALQANGVEALAGAQIAQQQINALGGVLGKQIDLVVKDDTSDPATTLKLVQQLQTQGAIFGVGPTGSPNAEALRSLVTSKDVLYVSPSAASPLLDTFVNGPLTADGGLPGTSTTTYGPLYRTIATDSFQATAIAQYATAITAGVRRCSNVAVIYQNDDYGQPIYAAVLSATSVQHVPVQTGAGFTLGSVLQDDATYTGIAQTVATGSVSVGASASPIACQIVIAQPAVAAAYMRNYVAVLSDPSVVAARGSATPILTIGSDGMRDQSFIVSGRVNTADPTSATAGEGSFVIAAKTADTTRPEYNAFLDLFQAQNPGADPGRYGSTAYDAVVTLALAMQYAGTTTDVAAVSAALAHVVTPAANVPTVTPDKLAFGLTELQTPQTTIDYEGASGALTWGQSGNTGATQSDFGVWQITGGQFNLVATIKASVLAQ